jgi:hypothetical protein
MSGQVLLKKGDIPFLEAPLPTDLHAPKLSAPGQGIDRVWAQVELNGCLAAGKERVVEFSFAHVDHSPDTPLDKDFGNPNLPNLYNTVRHESQHLHALLSGQ